MAKVVKRSDLSKKDYRVDTGIFRVKDSVFNITSDIGNGSKADFNEIDPLLYWIKPTDAKNGAVAHVLFNDGLGYYTFNGTLWSLDFFYPSSAYVSPGPKRYKAYITQVGTDAPSEVVLINNTSRVLTFEYVSVGTFRATLSGDPIDPNKIDIRLDKAQTNNSPIVFYNVDLEFNNIQLSINTGVLETDGVSIIPTLYNGILEKNILTIDIYP